MSTFAEYTKKKKKKDVDVSELAKKHSSFRGYTEEVLGVELAPIGSPVKSTVDIAPVKPTVNVSSAKPADKITSLMSVYGNKDFSTKSGYVSTKSEGIWEKLGSKYGMNYNDLQYEYINNQNDIRKEIDSKARSWGSDTGKTSSSYKEKALDYMTDDEVAVYNYYYQTEGKDKAQEFLDALAETLNARKAGKDFESIEGKTAREILYGTVAGAEQFKQGVKGFGSMITGKDDYIPQTSTQILTGMINEDLADDGAKVFGKSLGQFGHDYLSTVTNMLPSVMTGGVAGTILMGATAAGNAYQQDLNEFGDKEKARNYATTIGALEGMLQYALGGIGQLGGTSAAISNAVSGVKNSALRFALEYGGKIGSEALEEGLQEVLNPIVKNAVHGTEEEVDWENVAYSALLGGLMGGVFGATEVSSTHLNANENAVVDKVYKDTIAEKEADGNKLSQKEKAKIYDETLTKLEKGYIDIDTIESVLGGDAYNSYKAEVDKEAMQEADYKRQLEALKDQANTLGNAQKYQEIETKLNELKNNSKTTEIKKQLSEEVSKIVQGTRLAESYNEKARRGQYFEADLNKYEGKQKEIIQQAIDSKVLNNTNKTHEFVDWLARVSADKGVSFDFMNNQKLKDSGFAVEGKTINGFRQGNKITVNMQSRKELSTVVGHEITHVLEGSPELYDALAKDVKSFAELKGVYESMYNTAFENYKNVYKDLSEDDYKKAIEKEVVADLVGDYIFSDADFVRSLSLKNRNVFEKVYDEIKYFLKTVTAGSDAEKQLLKAKRTFEEVYRESEVKSENTEDSDVQYSLVTDQETIDFLEDQEYMVVYKAMQVIDGKLYPPMSAEYKVTEEYTNKKGEKKTRTVRKLKQPSQLGKWQQADETPDSIKSFQPPSKKYPEGYGQFDLLKGTGSSSDDVPKVAYNPYEHTSNIVLNDQFSSAYRRDNLVTVEYHIPKSELTSGYKAKYAKDSVGLTDWKAGGVAQSLKNSHRDVYLTRWSKPVRVVPDSEVAQKYKEILDKEEGISVPWNVVTPDLRVELEKLGVPIDYSDYKAGKATITYENHLQGAYDDPKAKANKKSLQMLSSMEGVQMSISTEHDLLPKPKPSLDPTSAQLQKDTRSVREIRNETMLKNDYTVEEVEQTNQFFDEMGEFMKKAGMTYKYIGLEDVNNAKLKITYDNNGNPQKIVLSAMVKNGDYPVNFDFTSICKKRQSISLVVKELAKRQTDGKRTLDVVNMSPESLWKINEELRKEGLETACLGCFVESKRYNIQNFSTKATNMWNRIVNEVRKEQGIEGNVEYFNFAEGTDLDSVDYAEVDRIFKDYATQPNRTSPENRMRALIRSGGAMYQKYLQPSDLMTPEGIEAIKSMSSKKNNFYGILQGVYGQAAPKEVMGFSPYNSEIALLPEKKGRQVMSEYIKAIGGVRMQSFSDFLVANVYDYMQMVGDLAARKLPAHAYTKEIAFAKIFGMTGIKVNMSVMFDIDSNLPNEYAGLTFVEDVNGDEEYNGVRGRFEYLVADQNRSDSEYQKTGNRPYVQSIPFDEAVALQRDARYSKNVGIIGVGYSDNHILKMLGDDDIRYVIPYHASSLPAIIKDATKIRKATDYTDSQTIRKLKSITDGNGNPVDFNEFRQQFETVAEAYGRLSDLVKNEGWQVQYGGQGKSKFNLYKDLEKTNEPRQTVENYLEYCAKNTLMPVFDQFAGHENYYKLIYDFDPYDSVTGEYAPQTAVSNIYDGYNASEGQLSTESIQDLIDGEMLIQNEKNRVRNEKIPSVVDSVLDQLGMKEDVQHSISDENQSIEKLSDGFYGEDLALAPVMENQTIEKNSTVEMPIRSDYAPLTEDEANVRDDRQIDEHYFLDDMPTETEETYNGSYADHMKPADPFYEKDIWEVGRNRKQKAYMYENPEVKPFFQQEARYMLGELDNSHKGEKFYNDQLYYDTNGEMGFFGTKRFTSEDIAYLLDTFNYTYKDIAKGLNAIIEDNGKENNAISKRIEFLLDERLRTGYTDFWFGDKIPPNQDYINLLNSKEITQYNDESWNNWLRGLSDDDVAYLSNTREDVAPPQEYMSAEPDIAPVAVQSTTSQVKQDVAVNEESKPIENELDEKRKEAQSELAALKRERYESLTTFEDEIGKMESQYYSMDVTSSDAQDILNRMESMEKVRDRLIDDYDRRIGNLEAKVTRMNSPKYQTAMQRKAIQKKLSDWASDIIGDTSTWVDKKLGIQYRTNTLRRNLRDIVRTADGKRDIERADYIYDELQGEYNKNEAWLKRESAHIKKPYADMKVTKAEDKYIQMLGEFRHNPQTTLTKEVVEEYYEKNKDNIDIAKVEGAIQDARNTYDALLERVNKSLREHGMKEIPYRKGYFPHFTEDKQSFLARLLNWKTINTEIPTSIAGITEMFNPERSWQSFNKQRKTDETDYSFTKGLDAYVHGSLDWIYHIEDIQRRRAFENHIRYIHSEQGIKDRIDAIKNNEEYDYEEAQEQIDLVYREAGNPLNNFVTDLRAGTNALANKKSSLDRTVEELTNRKVYSTMTNLSNRVTGNMVVGSVSSALTNFIPITQSWMQVSPVRSLQAMGETIKSTIKDDGTIDKSDYLTNRLRGEENLYKTTWDKISDKAGFLMEAVDSFTSQVVWRSKYNDNISNGMSEVESIKNADQFAENVMAGRSRGNMPTIFESKNPLIKTLTAFQLEVANQYGYLFKDAPQDMKNDGIAKLTKGYATAFFGAYAYNALYSSLTGRDAAFDPIRIVQGLLEDLGLFGDDEEEEKLSDTVLNLTDNILEEVPFVGGLLGGGRIPISSALPYDGIYEAFKGTITDIENEDWKNLTTEWLNPVTYLALPMGGGQIKKSIQGLSMFSDDHPVAGSYTQSGSLRFPVEDTIGSKAKAIVFGQYASSNAREYFDRGQKPLSKKRIQEYKDVDLPISEYWDYTEGLKGLKTLSDKADYINSLDLPIAKKNLLVNNQSEREEPIDLTGFDDEYENFDEFDFAVHNPEKYDVALKVGGYKKYKKITEGMSGMTKLEEKIEYIAGLNLSIDQKNALANSLEDRKEPFDLTGYENYDSYEEFKLATESPKKYSASRVIGYDDYSRYIDEINDIEGEKDSNGKTKSGTQKRNRRNYIFSLDLDFGQKAILYRSIYGTDGDKEEFNKDIVNYLDSRDDISYEEMVEILESLEMNVYPDGRITW